MHVTPTNPIPQHTSHWILDPQDASDKVRRLAKHSEWLTVAVTFLSPLTSGASTLTHCYLTITGRSGWLPQSTCHTTCCQMSSLNQTGQAEARTRRSVAPQNSPGIEAKLFSQKRVPDISISALRGSGFLMRTQRARHTGDDNAKELAAPRSQTC